MELWLKELDKIINTSIDDIQKIDYKNIIYIFYRYLSNRNLARLISYLYKMDEIDIYFKIDKIMSDNMYNKEEVDMILTKLNSNNFEKWIESDDF